MACLYLSPLKALINDQEERIATFCRPTGLSLAKWHGDVPKGERGWNPDDAPQFLLITPESLEVLLHEHGPVAALTHLRYVIVDELHAFVESERGVHLRILLDRLDRIAAAPVQRIGLSATVGNPEEVLAWLSGGRGSRRLVAVPAPATEKKFRFVIEPDPARRIDALAGTCFREKSARLCQQPQHGRVDPAGGGRSDKKPAYPPFIGRSRQKKGGRGGLPRRGGACIICTSTLELGIDIGDLDIVVQVGPPDSVSSFLQRMGRSGRRDQSAFVAWLLADPKELLTSCAVIECAREKRIEPLRPPEKPWNVLVQQIFLHVLSASRAGRSTIVRDLLSLFVFSHFSVEDVDRLLSSLVSAGVPFCRWGDAGAGA